MWEIGLNFSHRTLLVDLSRELRFEPTPRPAHERELFALPTNETHAQRAARRARSARLWERWVEVRKRTRHEEF